MAINILPVKKTAKCSTTTKKKAKTAAKPAK